MESVELRLFAGKSWLAESGPRLGASSILLKAACLFSLALLLSAGAISAGAQTSVNEEQGLKPHDSLHGGDLDSVSLTNGSLLHHIPLACFPQRGSLNLCFSVYSNTKNWQAVGFCTPDSSDPTGWNCSGTKWEPLPRGGLLPITPQGIKNPPNYLVDGAYVASSVDYWFQAFSQVEPIDPNNPPNQNTYDWAQNIVSPDGNVHQIANASGGSTLGGPSYPLRSLDPSGMLVPDGQTLILPSGTRFSFANGMTPQALNTAPSSVTDANGNQITINSSTGAFTDTLGRVIPAPPGTATSDLSNCPSGTASAKVWIVPGVAGVNNGSRTFKFCYSNFTIYTSFGSSTNEYPSTSTPLLSAIVLPDLTLWTFAYDNYGDVTQLGLPTGGFISYSYNLAPGAMGISMVATSRTVNANDGTGGHTWTYSYSGQLSGNPANYSGKAIVTSPDGNDAVHTVANVVPGAWSSLYDTQIQYYQGSQSTGTLLKTVATQYSGMLNPMTPGAPTSYAVVPTQVTTTWPNGHSNKVVNTWDSGNSVSPFGQGGTVVPVVLGSLLQRDEYDFSNSLARSTLNHYLWQDNSTYLNDNLISLPASSTVKDGSGNQVAQTTYTYDQYGQGQPAASGITTGHVSPPAGGTVRGNATTASHWLNTTNSLISSSATYFDTGMKASSTDPLNHTTNYTYSSAFAGAYLTQTNMPDTQMPDQGAPVVHHIVSGNYDFNTGLLTSFTDENSQIYTYQYDIMLRLTQGNHPDGGQTVFTYPDSNTVTRQRLMSTGTYEGLYTAKFDGLARSIESLQATPSGTVEVDTAYDSVGRETTVSNPYYQGSSHSTDPTYGVVQTQYDGMSRVVKSIKQDGSAASISYNDNCTTTTDESGKQREVCTDALGRMTQVLEPNPGAAATYSTGWVSVSGSEQSANSQPATSGSGTLTISGTEQTACNFIRGRCFTVYDTGTVTITVNGYAKTVNYGRSATAATIAWALSCAFHNDSSSPVDAFCPGSAGSSTAVTLTARATGASTNYSFTASSATSDTQCNFFCGPSFAASPVSGALSGGQNASSTPDTGTVQVTINGTPYSVSYGAGDTASTIAGRLVTAISAGSYASASPSGGTVSLTSKTLGTAGDYSLSASYTWNSSQFTNPSFTTSTSGSALSGALDASGLNNSPYVTLYQYDPLNDLLCVHQKATDTTADVACTGGTPPSVSASWRQRFFTYDSLSRLLTATNPESGKITYAYDAGGNTITKTEPMANQAWGSTQTVTITYAYDALNRLTDKTYSDATQNSSYRYDYSSFMGQSFQYPIGRQIAATAATGTISYFTSYDQMGRVKQTTQCIPGVANCQTFTAGYDLLGDMQTLAYPGSSFTVTYSYDSAARLTQATDSNGVTYAQNPTILASGAVQEFISPNFNNNKLHTDLNNRLQPTEIWAGSAQGSGALFDKQYSYNPPSASQVNNGNIYTVTNVKDSTRTQTFTYDPLNRLISAGDGTHWGNTYAYDAWGNLQKTPGSPAGETFQHAADTNNHLTGFSYDAAGNMTNDGTASYTYDSENRITAAIASGVTTNYSYDADGRRVKKSSGPNYWYGPGGQTLAETDLSGNWTYYVFFGGQRLARNIPQPSPNPADIKYYVTDHLHSTAMFVDKAGTSAAILDDNDFYPWGGVVPGVGKTTSTNTVKFTGKYRDNETQLDYFGARYYANISGRWMSPDWAAKPVTVPYADFGDPQSLNLYAYVRNSPVIRVDADGHNFAGYDGFMADKSGGMEAYQQGHGAYGVDADYDSITNLATGQTDFFKPGTTPGPPTIAAPSVPPFAFDQARINKLTVQQVAGVVFNENRDVMPGESTPEQLQAAKTAQAHAVINGDRMYGNKRQARVGTAPWKVSNNLKQSAQFQQALAAARTAFQEDNLGIDSTGGRVYFNNRFEGTDLKSPRVSNGQSQNPFHTYGPFAVGGGKVWTVIFDDFK